MNNDQAYKNVKEFVLYLANDKQSDDDKMGCNREQMLGKDMNIAAEENVDDRLIQCFVHVEKFFSLSN